MLQQLQPSNNAHADIIGSPAAAIDLFWSELRTRPLKWIRKIVGLIPALLLSACASVFDEDGALATIPYDINAERGIVVETWVNGEGPYRFALDTAASISVVFENLSSELALEAVSGNPVTIHGLVASGEYPLLHVDSLSVGREVWSSPTIVSMPGETVARAGIDGILGMDFLKRYTVQVSVTDQIVRLYSTDRLHKESYNGWTSVPLELLSVGDTRTALYFFDVEIGDERMPAVFDLGASLNMMNWAAANKLGLDQIDLRKNKQLSGAIDSTPAVARIRAGEVTTGEVSWQNEEFVIAELEIFTTLRHDNTPCAILGAGLFTQRDFVIDFTRNRLLVKTAMGENSSVTSSNELRQ